MIVLLLFQALACLLNPAPPFADANGDHYGMHPCGGWAIDAPIIDAILGEN